MRAPRSPQLRFLLRGSALVIVLLALWWWLLRDPMLDALRLSTDAVVHLWPGGGSMARVKEDSRGNWLLQVPLPASWANRDATQKLFGASGQGNQAVRVRSLRLAMERDVPVLFSLVFPLLWAITLAAPWSKRSWTVLLAGTGLVWLVAQCCIVVYTAYTIHHTLQPDSSGSGGTMLDFAEYLAMYVAPYLSPFLIALALHKDLRTRILYGEPARAEGPRPRTESRIQKPGARRKKTEA